MVIATAPTSVSTDAASATTFARSRAKSTAKDPTSGTTARTVIQGKPVEEVISAHSHQQERGSDRERTDQHRQGVGAGEAGLGAAQPCTGAADQRRQAVDPAVDATAIEQDQRAGEVGARPHEHV